MTLAVLKKWTCLEFQRLADIGAFQPTDKIELIEGMIVEMSPQNYPHGLAITRATSLLVRLFDKTHYVRVQLPLNVGLTSQPEPDFALVRREIMDAGSTHPDRADLVIEVSESSLSFDRGEKMLVYGRGGFPEYWIVNVVDGVLEVHREPDAQVGYRSRQVWKKTDKVAPLFRPNVSLLVSKLF